MHYCGRHEKYDKIRKLIVEIIRFCGVDGKIVAASTVLGSLKYCFEKQSRNTFCGSTSLGG